MEFSEKETADLIPHKGKMRFIDRVLECDFEKTRVVTETKIKDDFLLLSDGAVPSYALFEFSAQSVAALLSADAKEHGRKMNAGFILSVSASGLLSKGMVPGQTVRVEAEKESNVENVYSFDSRFFVDGESLGSAKITVMEANG